MVVVVGVKGVVDRRLYERDDRIQRERQRKEKRRDTDREHPPFLDY